MGLKGWTRHSHSMAIAIQTHPEPGTALLAGKRTPVVSAGLAGPRGRTVPGHEPTSISPLPAAGRPALPLVTTTIPHVCEKEATERKISPFLANFAFSIGFFPFFCPMRCFFHVPPPLLSSGCTRLCCDPRSHPPAATKDRAAPRTHKATFVKKQTNKRKKKR